MFDCDEMFTSESDESLPPSPIYDRYQSGDVYHVVPLPYTGTFMPPKPDLVFYNAPNVNKTVHTAFNVEHSPTKPDTDLSHTHRPLAPIIEDWFSDSKDDSEAEILQNAPSFVQPNEQVKTPRPSVKPVETSILAAILRQQFQSLKAIETAGVERHALCGNPQHAFKENGVIYSGCSRHMIENMSYLSDFEEINGRYITFGGNPKGVKISGKDKIRTGKLDFDDVYFIKELKFNLFSVLQMYDKKNNVLFIDTECIVLPPEFKLLDKNQVLLRVPRENNMYNVELKNIVSSEDLTCLFAKATLDEVLVAKPQNKTPCELLLGRTPSIGFMRPFDCPLTILNILDPLGKFDKKADEGFLVGYSDTDGDAAFKVKELEFERRNPESKVHVSPSSKFEDFSDNIINEVNTAGTSVHAVGQFSTNSTNTFSAAGPSNTAVTLEDITYYDDEEDVSAEADFTNLETTITEELLQFKMQKVWVLVDLPNRKGGIVARIEVIRLFLAYTSFMGFMVYQMDVKSAFLYGTIKEEVYVCQPPGFEDPNYPDKVYKVVKALYGLHQAPRAWYETLANYLLENGFQREKIDKTLFIKRQQDGKSASTPIDTEKSLLKDPDGEDVDVHTYRSMIVKRIFRYLKGKPHLGLWYLKDSPFNLVAYSDGDYAGASLDRKSKTRRCQFLGCRLISWQCKKQTVVATSSTEAEYVAAASCSIDCLPNEEIFTELSRMGYEKPSTKLTFYKAFFSPQWKFLINTILQCMSAERTSWNKFSSSMASAIICLSTGRKFNFFKYIFDSLVRNVDSSTKFYMYPRFLQLMIRAQVGDLSLHSTKYSSPALTQKVFATMRRVGKGFFGVDKPLFEGMLVAQEDVDVVDEGAASVAVDDVLAAADEPSIPSPTPTTLPPPPLQDLPSTSQGVIANIDTDEDVTLKDVAAVEQDAEIKENADDDELEPAELQEVVEVVTTAKLMTKVVSAASATITAADTPIPAATITTAPSAARRRKGVTKEQMEEEDSKALKRASESQAKKAAKKQKLDEEATPLVRKVPVVDYEIYTETNKPYYKIMRADGSHQLFLSFLSLLRNFDREDLECSWISKGQKLETVRVLWTAHHHIYNYTDDLDGREKISTNKVYFGSNAQQCEEGEKELVEMGEVGEGPFGEGEGGARGSMVFGEGNIEKMFGLFGKGTVVARVDRDKDAEKEETGRIL
uniref:Uncharacterized protein n=1 Tax=Tanacetum cinerariifolium TaxID=118510 RepID=A0A6L2MXZ0_TANCI|nr:hypothetical protein [Tanacetum cinerariifolium]